ncbi:MAG: GDSL family lipase [Chloroflexi bacterium]|nr:GDSL family lipase [Chloroflexota bacterium]
MKIPSDDDRLVWSGAISLERRDGWVKPWRAPWEDLDLFSPGSSGLAERAAQPSGVRIRFTTNAEELTFQTEPMTAPGSLDLYADDTLVQAARFDAGQTQVSFTGLPAGEKTIELWLSPSVTFCLRNIDLPDGASFKRQEDARPRWVVYGSSITQCRTARSPSFTWPAIVARARGLNLTSLGYGGNCHADPMVARLIRDLPADLVSLKVGINIHNQRSMSLRSFRPAVIGMIAAIRDGHPNTPLVVCSPIWSPGRESAPNGVGMTLEIMRNEIRDSVASFAMRGDSKIYYVDGLRLFDESAAEYLPDDLHPSAAGYELLAANFLREVFEEHALEIGSNPHG